MAELFVKQAEVYSRARPKYPDSLFSFLVSLTPSQNVAWDVGTGNGQAAVAVRRSSHFSISCTLLYVSEIHQKI